MRTLLLGLTFACLSPAAKPLEMYFIDTEGGKATLVSPSGESMLIDAGFPGENNRDASRIAAAAKLAGVKQIDHLLVTHHHADHVGGVPQIAALLPIKHFIDHGPNMEAGARQDELYKNYKDTIGSSRHTVATPGQKIPVKGLDVLVLSSHGDLIAKPVKGAGAPNPLCASAEKQADAVTENPRSLGVLVTFGKFRMIDLADLLWSKEVRLVCPNNLIGTVDVYVTSHHGAADSGHPALVHALKPLVGIMNNGVKKGGAAAAWQVMRQSPGVVDLWQLHFAVAGGAANNSAEPFIANPDPDQAKDQGHWIKLSAESDGSFTVTNGRSNVSKEVQTVTADNKFRLGP